MSGKQFATGHCLCGAVHFTIRAEPVGTGHCHCKDCQRSSGSGHMSIARFRRTDVTLSGQTASYAVTADSGNTNTRHFCPTCGSRLFGENSGHPELINIAVGCVDDNNWFVPGRVVYAKDRPIWDATTGDAPNFDRMPP
ncbi:MAG TPA: GFA family protein [Acetobacteraceae bacterium]|jgi:hypothetical protein|nr:GFA family protein [Acetobacteraceae bacterium]